MQRVGATGFRAHPLADEHLGHEQAEKRHRHAQAATPSAFNSGQGRLYSKYRFFLGLVLALMAVVILSTKGQAHLRHRRRSAAEDDAFPSASEDGGEDAPARPVSLEDDDAEFRVEVSDEDLKNLASSKSTTTPKRRNNSPSTRDHVATADKRFWADRLAQKRAFKKLDEVIRARSEQQGKGDDETKQRRRVDDGENDGVSEALKKMRMAAREAKVKAYLALRSGAPGMDEARAADLAATGVQLSVNANKAVQLAAKAAEKKPHEFDQRLIEYERMRRDREAGRRSRLGDIADEREREKAWKSELAEALNIPHADVESSQRADPTELDLISGRNVEEVGAHVFLCLDDEDVTSLVKALSDIVVGVAHSPTAGGQASRLTGKMDKAKRHTLETLSIHVITARPLIDRYATVISQNFAYLNVEVTADKTEVHSKQLHVRVSLPQRTIEDKKHGLRQCRKLHVDSNHNVEEADKRADVRFNIVREIAREEWD